MTAADQTEVDSRLQHYYTYQFSEAERLTTRSAQGRLEFERTQELVTARVRRPSRILDVGGAAGIHAAALAALGHEVVLIDPVVSHVEQARAHGTFVAEVGDARNLAFEDDSFDAALLFGPLYHLAEREVRLRALREAARVVRSGGWVFAQAIPRFTHHATLTLGRPVEHPYPADLVAVLEHGEPGPRARLPAGHYHTSEEFEAELAAAGLADVEVCAVEGPSGLALEELDEVEESVYQGAIDLVRLVGHRPGLRDLTCHLMGTARVA
jgi:SAM-dependent methyltransferase